jgi:hypothetical protein
MVPALTGPTPKTSVTLVPEALTSPASFLLVSRSRASRWRMSARNSAASSQRARAAAPAGVTRSRIAAARATVISLPVPPGTRPQHRVQPAGGLVTGTGQVPVPPGPRFQHHAVVLGEHRARGLRPQCRDGHRQGVIRIVLAGVPGLQQPHPGGQLGRHLFRCGDQLLGQQAPQPGSAFHRPGPPRPLHSGRPATTHTASLTTAETVKRAHR